MYKIKNWLIHSDHPLVTNLITNEEKRIGYHDHLVILMLCNNSGKINTKEELLKGAWPGKHVSEGSLTQSISAIRTLIEDDGKAQKHLKTVAKVGYKLESDAVSWQGEEQDGLMNQDTSLVEESDSEDSVLVPTVVDRLRLKLSRTHMHIAAGCLFVSIAVLFPFVFTEKNSRLGGWLPLTKIFSTQHIAVYCDDEEAAKAVAKGVAPLVREKVAQGKLDRLALALSDETLSIVILKPLSPPINLVIMLDSPQPSESLVDMIQVELNDYVY